MATTTERLAAGEPAPDFTLPDQGGEERSLHDYRGKNVVLYFYPAAMTPGCTTEACDFQDSLNSLGQAGYQVLGVSKDEPAANAEFAEQEALTFPLLSDPDLSVHRAYGAYGEKSSYGKTVTGTIRSTFVIDEAGVVAVPMYDVKATGHVARLRKQLGIA